MATETTAFGELLRAWRAAQRMSQLELSLAAGVSSRHISFIETGRSRPSREMVLRLAETLTLSLRDRNRLLVAAGFVPAYRESGWESVDIEPVRRGLELVLASHEPFPAFVLDRGWNILLANRSHHRMLARLRASQEALPEPVNVMRLVLDPSVLRPLVVNWAVAAHALGHRLRRQLRSPYLEPALRRHLEELLALPGVREAMADVPVSPNAEMVLPLCITLDGRTLSWFSTIATIGAPQDVTLDEIFIESLFPADEDTDRAARRLAEGT